MMIIRRSNSLRLAGLALASGALLASTAAPLAGQDRAGQDGADEARLRKIEAEVRALQRKVFPGGDGRLFEPQIAPGTQAPTTSSAANAPTSTAVTDILVRLDALELQLQALTARSEEHGNTLALLESRLAALETGSGAPLVVPTGNVAALPPPTSAPTLAPTPAATLPAATAPVPVISTTATNTPQTGASPALTPGAAPATTPAVRTVAPTPATPAASSPATSTAAAPSAARIAAVQAIAKPQTDDAGDDEYSYGFRLWSAGFFPEARQQLTRFVEQYPRHARISYARNLLGRAFLDDAMPEEAARWFLRNYQADRNAERAPDSLLYLGKAMIALKDTRRACIALAEFGETYPALASGRLASDYQSARGQVTCQ